LANDVILALPKTIQSGVTPQQAANAVSGSGSLPAEGIKQLIQTLIQQLFDERKVPFSDFGNSTPAESRKDVAVSIEALGVSSGVAFNVSATNNGTLPVQLQGEGVVVEPVRGAPSISTAATPGLTREGVSISTAGAPPVTREEVEAFCLERVRPVAPPGTQYRVAPPAVQMQHRRLVDILHAAKKVMDVGGLHPDSDVKGYFNFIRQWSIWTRQENFDEKKFTEEFVNQTKKNVEAKNIKWTGDMQDTVRKAAPGRWRDVTAVLNAANQPKSQASAIESHFPIALTAPVISAVDIASTVAPFYLRRRHHIGELS
jgi:hypothetical protein